VRRLYGLRWQLPAERLQQIQRHKQEEVLQALLMPALLDVQEGQLTKQLFEQGTLNLFISKLADAKPEALRGQLKDASPLIRLLTVQAVGRRRLPLVPDLIERLLDDTPAVREAARLALVRLARGTDFGPLPGWSRVGIQRSVDRWQQWLALQQTASSDTPAHASALGRGTPAPGELTQPASLSPGLMIDKVLAPSASTLEAADPRVVQMAAELVAATGDEQAEALARLRDAKGIEHTDALARAIPQLAGGVRDQARDALVRRLTRMTAKTLRAKLEEDDPEVRRAAALACARKESEEHIPDLLKLLDDPEAAVVQAARQALHGLAGQDFGPKTEAGPAEHARAIAAWKDWWRKRPAVKK
jgi:HEAT repeat protein